MIGASALVYLCMMATNIVPYLGVLVSLILTGPLMGGLWIFYVKTVRNQPATIGDAFGGFGPRFWQFVLQRSSTSTPKNSATRSNFALVLWSVRTRP